MDESQKPADEASPSYNGAARSPSGQVMDIQSPKPTTDTAPNLPAFPTELDSESDATAPASVTNPPVAAETIAESPEPVQDATSETTTSPPSADNAVDEGTAAPQPADPNHNPLAIPPHASHKSGAPVVAIVVAILVALGLAALVAFTFMKSKNKTTPVTNSNTTQTAAKPLASPADVDTTNKELETSLSKIDESKDFPATDLSDKSLGL